MRHCSHAVPLLALFLLSPLDPLPTALGACDKEYFTKTWLQQEYTGPLSVDRGFFRYTAVEQYVLTNELALRTAVRKCVARFTALKEYLGGRHGPVSEQSMYDVMCSAECLEADDLHQKAMEASGCSCLELSTQEDEATYHVEGDVCRRNSARILCNMYGQCGEWNCRIDDFMCPRYEWNRRKIRFKGRATCEKSGGAVHTRGGVLLAVVSAILALLLVNFR